MDQLLRSIWQVLKHPVSGVLIGIVVALVIFYAARSKIEPRYAISIPELIAEQSPDAPKMTILWEGETVKNVVAVKVAVWNDGSRFLDKTLMSITDPIRIVPSQTIRILSAQAIRASRENLRFDTPIEQDDATKKQFVKVGIRGDEALDKGDGVLIKILYDGTKDCAFTVLGRIKGCPQGFQQVSWKTAAGGSRPKSRTVMFAIMVVLYVPMGVYAGIRGARRLREGKKRIALIFITQAILILLGAGFVAFSEFRWLLKPGWIQ